MTDQDAAVLAERISAIKEALIIAKVEMDRRLNEMNEFREQINRERGEYVSLKEYESKHEILRLRIETVEKRNSNMDGRMWAFGAVISGLVFLINLAFRYW